MLHRPDLPGSANESPQMDDFYYYMAVGDLASQRDFFVDQPKSIEKPTTEQKEQPK